MTYPLSNNRFVLVDLPGVILAFSYRTLVGFWSMSTGWLVAENEWGSVTGRHLNHLDHGKKDKRVPQHQVEYAATKALRKDED